jgi:hypothetical protein
MPKKRKKRCFAIQTKHCLFLSVIAMAFELLFITLIPQMLLYGIPNKSTARRLLRDYIAKSYCLFLVLYIPSLYIEPDISLFLKKKKVMRCALVLRTHRLYAVGH